MSEKIAKEDIVVRNELGQNVVVVPKGQPIPKDFDEDEAAARTVPIRNAPQDEAEPVAGKAIDEPAENKSRTSSSRKRKG